MKITISNEISIREPVPELVHWIRGNLNIPNPEYSKKLRMGLWIGNTPSKISLYHVDGEVIIAPCGVGKQLRQFIAKDTIIEQDLANNGVIEYIGEVALYDYQKTAVDAMKTAGCGILQSPCGSGKTQMGIALASLIGRKTLWLTHTSDLLIQSYNRAKQYYPEETLGTITAGKIQIGTHITFATVQTLSKQDLRRYKYTWDTVIVDECHRVSGTPAGMKMFYTVMSSLAARYKYGLSATVHRADGLIKSTFAIIGDVNYRVPDDAVKDKTMQVSILRRETKVEVNRSCLDTDGTMEYAKLIPYLTEHLYRNQLIVEDLIKNKDNYNLVLSDRLGHLKELMAVLPPDVRKYAAMIDGNMTSKAAKARRIQAIEEMRGGEKHFLFATYGLAKEGLDIPRLDRLYLATPKKDYAVVTQSIGRISRVFDGKMDAVCYDYVDSIQFCENQWKRRRTHYKKVGCEFIG